jgi:4'-phosphopantetheinyl transferase
VGIRRITEHLSVGVLDLKAYSSEASCLSKREAEKSGAVFLLQKMLGKKRVKVSYTNDNKPFLEGRKEHISISHSHDKLAIAINSSESTGIDIELLREKVQRLGHKFLNEEESAFCGNDIEKMITVWAAKEALYKAGGQRGIDFRTMIEVSPAGEGLLTGTIQLVTGLKKYLLFYKRVENYMLVFTMHEI